MRANRSDSAWADWAAALDDYGNGNTLIAMVAYLDESGNSSTADTITISGIVARARDWTRLQKRWPRAMKGFPLPYHHTNFLDQQKKHRDVGDKASADEYDALQRKLIATLSDVDYFGFGSSVIRKDWDVVKDRCRRLKRYKNPWFLVFETAIGEIMGRTEDLGITEEISFVFDRIDGVSDSASELFSMIEKTPHEELPYMRRLGKLSFANTALSKDKTYPLQAADLFTYEANRYVRDTVVKECAPMRWQWQAIVEARLRNVPKAINGGIYRPDTLEELAQLIEQDRLREIAAFQKKMGALDRKLVAR